MSNYLRQEEERKLLEEIADCRACANIMSGFCSEHQSRFDKLCLALYPLGRKFVRQASLAKKLGYVIQCPNLD